MVNDIVKDLEGSVAKAHDSLKRELAKVRTGREIGRASCRERV